MKLKLNYKMRLTFFGIRETNAIRAPIILSNHGDVLISPRSDCASTRNGHVFVLAALRYVIS